MSWISENYEKASLGAAAVAALGLGFFGWQNLSAIEEDFSAVPKGGGSKDAAVKDGDKVATATKSFELDREWIKGNFKGQPVDLFTGVPLFVNKNDLGNPVDLPTSADVHEGIPNQWWIDKRIDPGYGDSPQRDEDGDGFSNMEEFIAETEPADDRSYPPLISKLSYVGDDSITWRVRPGYGSQNGSYTFEYNDTLRRENKTGAANPIPKGGLFFDEEPAKERFKYLDFEVREELDTNINANVKVTYVKFEDQKPNKKGMVYEVPALFKKRDPRIHLQYDRTAIITLEALDFAGQEIRVEEYTEFALPPEAEEKRFKMTTVTPESITVEETLEGGETKTYQILKGETGPTK